VQYIDTHRWYYDVNQRLDQRVLIGAVAEMQKWIDTGISMEFLFNYNPDTQVKGKVNAKVLYDTYIDAWKNGLKTVYYMRSVQEDKTKEKSECSACAN
jgi:ribonucleoside-diphosphate reductase alpha chain